MNELDLTIKDKIHTIKGKQVMLDFDLASLYGVSTKRLNEQVRRNIERFPKDFMFQLSETEYSSLRSQIATLNRGRGKHRKYLPFVFTEQGVAMLSTVLKSHKAVDISIKIMKAFVTMRSFLNENKDFLDLSSIKSKLFEHDTKINHILNELQNHSLPEKGIFFENKVFDAHVFISKIICSAKQEIILIDNYVDETTMNLFSETSEISIIIYTKNMSSKLLLAKQKFNEQYNNLEIKQLKKSHDRFLIIDKKIVYHIGASLKDLGKKWFAFSNLKINPSLILNELD